MSNLQSKPRVEGWAEIEENFDEEAGCEKRSGCDRAADWFIDYHGHKSFLLCDAHWRMWLAEKPTHRCPKCGGFWRVRADSCAVRPL